MIIILGSHLRTIEGSLSVRNAQGKVNGSSQVHRLHLKLLFGDLQSSSGYHCFWKEIQVIRVTPEGVVSLKWDGYYNPHFNSGCHWGTGGGGYGHEKVT